MKDHELREMFASLERKVVASTGAPHAFPEVNDRLLRIEGKLDAVSGVPSSEIIRGRDDLQHSENEAVRARLDRINEFVTVANNKDVERDQLLDVMRARLDRIQELCEQGRRFGDVPPPFQLPSPRVPLIVGTIIGALIFAAGMLTVYFLK